MLDRAREVLAEHRGDESRGWDIRAAADARLRSADLLSLALEETRASRERDGDAPVPATVVLLERSDDETRRAAHRLLASSDAAERELGARIMREFGPRDVVPRSHADEFLPALERAAGKEQDHGALRAELSAIGWQGLPQGCEVLLRFVTDDRRFIRTAVGDGLCALSAIDGEMRDDVGLALLALAGDPDPWVASSVLYDVAHAPALFQRHHAAFEKTARVALASGDEGLRETARDALQALSEARATS